MSGLQIDTKQWSDFQARAAMLGLQLMRSDGSASIVVLIDAAGKPHRVHHVEQIEDALADAWHPFLARAR